MDSPIVKNFHRSSGYTRGSYLWVIGSIVMIVVGYRYIRYHYANVWLECKVDGCELHISPHGSYGADFKKVFIDRSQIVRADHVKVNMEGQVMRSTGNSPAYTKKKGKKFSNGPDENGWYHAYSILLNEYPTNSNFDDDSIIKGIDNLVGSEREAEVYRRRMAKKEKQPKLSHELKEFITDSPLTKTTQFIFMPRLFNLHQTTRRAASAVTKINSYVKKRKDNITIREQAHISWQGLVAVLLGVFSLLLSLILGQFWEPEVSNKKHKMGGPGARKTINQNQTYRRGNASTVKRSSRALPTGGDGLSYGQTKRY
uniref:Uncharacterized protein n=1 Tax=Ditylum brightwellii TaxID=49249 RepID=A0A7S4T0E0_9STRA